MEHPLYRPLRDILQYANTNQQAVIAEAAEELNRLAKNEGIASTAVCVEIGDDTYFVRPKVAGEINRLRMALTAHLPAEIEEVERRHIRDNTPPDLTRNGGWGESHEAWAQRIGRQANTDRATLLSALRASEARSAAAYEDAASLVPEAMEDAWNEISADTGCHPLDIQHHGKGLSFSKSHWAESVAALLRDPNGREQVRAAAAIRAKANGGK